MVQIRQRDADQGSMKVWSVQPSDLPKVLQGLKNLPIETLLGEPEIIPVAEKVAWRYAPEKVGAFFNVGDLILYGKYKNKKGRIVQFSTNDKGQPIVEIEPIPKGRKKNKVMGLFKIWNVAVIEQTQKVKEAHMNLVAQRVADRYISAMGIGMGRTWEIDSVRVHRYRDHFKVTDLTNAGKRGKRVRVMTIAPTYYYKGDHDEWMERMGKAIPEYNSYDKIKGFIKDVLVDAPNEIQIDESEVRGVDVNPGGTTKITLTTGTGLEITSEPMDFMVRSRVMMPGPTGKPSFAQDTLYWPSNKKRDSPIFYNWLKANMAQANRMTITDFRKLWDDLKIPYDYH